MFRLLSRFACALKLEYHDPSDTRSRPAMATLCLFAAVVLLILRCLLGVNP